jgi:copper chaperone CopZ
MRTFILLAVVCLSLTARAQLKGASLQAAGLTCSMCSRSISKALEQLPFVEKVTANIKESKFEVAFKAGADADADELRRAVEGAGFSISLLQLQGRFEQLAVASDAHILIGGRAYHFVSVKAATLNGAHTLTVVDRNFLTARAFRKYAAATKMACIQTGRTGDCCKGSGVAANTRIYHVTL